MDFGYAATSMDAVADDAGVSKLTVYRHFGNKAALFSAVVERKCQEMLGPIDAGIGEGQSAREALINVGRRFVALITSEDAVRVHNVIVQERERAPELGTLFYESAVLNASERLAALIAELSRRGEMGPVDAAQAARDILALWRGQPVMHIELGIDRFGTADLDRHVERVVDLFLKAWR